MSGRASVGSADSLIVRGATRVGHRVVDDAPLYVAGGRVAPIAPRRAYELGAHDHVLIPALVNAHDHLHRNNLPPLAGCGAFPNSYAWMDALRRHFADPAVAAARAVPERDRFLHGGLKNILAGTAAVAHHDAWHRCMNEFPFPVRPLRCFGWSHSLGLGDPDWSETRGQFGPRVVESFLRTPRSAPWIIHLAEGTDAVAAAELARLERLGCLAANTVLVHCVGLSETDRDRVIGHGSCVVWCPASNLRLLGRTLDPRRLFAAGRLALGTDSRVSGSRDMLDEMQTAAEHGDLTPAEILSLATESGARLLRFRRSGHLGPAAYADFILAPYAGGDPAAALRGQRRRDLRAVALRGAPVIADPDFAEWFEAAGVEGVRCRLDGRPKLCAAWLLRITAAAAQEPGLEIDAA